MKHKHEAKRSIVNIILFLLFLLVVSALVSFIYFKFNRNLYIIHYHEKTISYDIKARENYILVEKHDDAHRAETASYRVDYTQNYHHLFNMLVKGRQNPEVYINSNRSGISDEYLSIIRRLVNH